MLDADLEGQDLLLRFQYSNTHTHTDYRRPVGETGWRGHSLKRRVPLRASATPSRRERQEPCHVHPL